MEKDRESGTSPAAYPTWHIRSQNLLFQSNAIFAPAVRFAHS